MQTFFVLIGQAVVWDFLKWLDSHPTVASAVVAGLVFIISATTWLTTKFLTNANSVSHAKRNVGIALRRTRSFQNKFNDIDRELLKHEFRLDGHEKILMEMREVFVSIDRRFDKLAMELQSFRHEVNTRFDRLEARMDRLEVRFDRLEGRIDRLEERVSKLELFITQLVISSNNLNMAMSASMPGFVPILIARSPLRLSETGFAILEKSGGRKYVDHHHTELMRILEGKKLMSRLDIQNESYLVLNERAYSEDFVDIRNYVYENPGFRTADGAHVPLMLMTVLQVMGIYLRDLYLDTHPYKISLPPG